MRATKAVIESHLKSFGEGDLAGILADYAPDAVLFTPSGPLRGVGEIRTLFEAMVAEFAKPGATFALSLLDVAGDHAYIVWEAETADNVYELGTDTFVVKDGKICAQSFACKVRQKRREPAGEAAPRAAQPAA